MVNKYTHLELNKDIRSIAGYYTPQREVRLKDGGREVLYVIGQATIECSCCASGTWAYALVPGYIVNWQKETNKAGLPLTEVEPVSDEDMRKKLSQIIKEKEGVTQVEFW